MDENRQRHRIRFGLRTLFEVIAVAAFILALFYYREPQSEHGHARYQLEVIAAPDDVFGSQQWVIDTQTGEVWELDGAQWHSKGRAPQRRERANGR